MLRQQIRHTERPRVECRPIPGPENASAKVLIKVIKSAT